MQIFLRIFPFSNMLRKKNSEYFSAPFWDGQLLDYKEKFSLNIPENVSKQQKSIV